MCAYLHVVHAADGSVCVLAVSYEHEHVYVLTGVIVSRMLTVLREVKETKEERWYGEGEERNGGKEEMEGNERRER